MNLKRQNAYPQREIPGPAAVTFPANPNEAEMRSLRVQAVKLLESYSSPGSAARLQPVLDRLHWMCRHDDRGMQTHDVVGAPQAEPMAPSSGDPPDEVAFEPLSRVVRDHIIRVYYAMGCNKTRAARVLEIDVKTLYNKLKRYGLQ
ncbi:MAG: helix-turn-helix domain-containing protein [Planctomycetota bacterium]|jgi:DNA-binding NtrC family response regulator